MSISVVAFQDRLSKATKKEKAGFAVTSPAIHFATFVQIYNKENMLIRPKPNILQLRMSQAYEQCMAWGIPCRMLVVKPRQVGCSTFAAHICYHHEQRFRSTGITIADVADNSQGLMKKIAEYSERDSFPWNNRLRAYAKKLIFANGTEHTIDSAENWKAGISKTRQVFHGSEVGLWPKSGVKEDKRVMASVMPSIAKKPRTVVIAEGTPCGAVGWLYDTWTKEAVTLEKLAEMREAGTAPGIIWIKVFAAWFEFEEYQHDGKDGRPGMEAAEIKHIERTLTERERRGIDLYQWTVAQIAWRRAIIATECGGDENVMDEFYPEDDESCWLSSGRPRFNIGALKTMDRMARGNLPEAGHLVIQEDRGVHWSPDSDGDVFIWEKPLAGCRYLVSCDPMTGADQTTGEDPDRHSIGVLRQGYTRDDGETCDPALVARVRAPFIGDSDEAAGQIVGLSRMYGNCMTVLEVNMGLHILELLKFEGIPVLKRKVFSARLGQKIEQFGYKLTNRDERRFVIDALATAIRNLAITVWDEHAITECKNFVTAVNGRDEARAGAHDDDVFMLAMGYISLASATTYYGERRKRREPPDRKDWKKLGAHRP